MVLEREIVQKLPMSRKVWDTFSVTNTVKRQAAQKIRQRGRLSAVLTNAPLIVSQAGAGSAWVGALP
jgi:hypothetical protein